MAFVSLRSFNLTSEILGKILIYPISSLMCPLKDALHSQLSNLKKDENLQKTILVHVESEFKQHIFKIYIVNKYSL